MLHKCLFDGTFDYEVRSQGENDGIWIEFHNSKTYFLREYAQVDRERLRESESVKGRETIKPVRKEIYIV